MNDFYPLPSDLATAHAMILAERAARLDAEARAQSAETLMSSARLEIERLRLLLAKARREQYGQSSERGAKIIAQLELQLAELEETAAEAETAAEIAAPSIDMRHGRAVPASRPAGPCRSSCRASGSFTPRPALAPSAAAPSASWART
jgi:transposase